MPLETSVLLLVALATDRAAVAGATTTTNTVLLAQRMHHQPERARTRCERLSQKPPDDYSVGAHVNRLEARACHDGLIGRREERSAADHPDAVGGER